MFHASLDVKLPPELPPPTASVRTLMGRLFPPSADDEGDSDEELREHLKRNLAVFECLLRAFESSGFDDVVAIVVDGKPAYVDVDERIGDFEEALGRLVSSKVLAKGFAVIRTTFRRRDSSLELLAELRCHARGRQRVDETRVRISARPLDHGPAQEEGPREYAQRVREYVRDADGLEAARARVGEVRDQLAAEIEARIPGCGIQPGSALIRFIAPGNRQLGRMRHLGFGTGLRSTVRCSLPSYERVGPYDDPLSRHYYSPYSDLFHWIAVGEVLEGHASSPNVEVVSATGRRLFWGDGAGDFDPSEFAVSRDVVRVSPQGRLKIDASVPEVGTLDSPEAGSPHSSGWGGEAWADDIEG